MLEEVKRDQPTSFSSALACRSTNLRYSLSWCVVVVRRVESMSVGPLFMSVRPLFYSSLMRALYLSTSWLHMVSFSSCFSMISLRLLYILSISLFCSSITSSSSTLFAETCFCLLSYSTFLFKTASKFSMFFLCLLFSWAMPEFSWMIAEFSRCSYLILALYLTTLSPSFLYEAYDCSRFLLNSSMSSDSPSLILICILMLASSWEWISSFSSSFYFSTSNSLSTSPLPPGTELILLMLHMMSILPQMQLPNCLICLTNPADDLIYSISSSLRVIYTKAATLDMKAWYSLLGRGDESFECVNTVLENPFFLDLVSMESSLLKRLEFSFSFSLSLCMDRMRKSKSADELRGPLENLEMLRLRNMISLNIIPNSLGQSPQLPLQPRILGLQPQSFPLLVRHLELQLLDLRIQLHQDRVLHLLVVLGEGGDRPFSRLDACWAHHIRRLRFNLGQLFPQLIHLYGKLVDDAVFAGRLLLLLLQKFVHQLLIQQPHLCQGLFELKDLLLFPLVWLVGVFVLSLLLDLLFVPLGYRGLGG